MTVVVLHVQVLRLVVCGAARQATDVTASLCNQHAALVGAMLSGGYTEAEVDQHLVGIRGRCECSIASVAFPSVQADAILASFTLVLLSLADETKRDQLRLGYADVVGNMTSQGFSDKEIDDELQHRSGARV